MPVLELRDITVERGGRAVVKDVTIPVPAGEVTALLGPNGAGKSSLVLAVGGVLRPRPGSVSLDGVELAGRRPEKIRAAGVATRDDIESPLAEPVRQPHGACAGAAQRTHTARHCFPHGIKFADRMDVPVCRTVAQTVLLLRTETPCD